MKSWKTLAPKQPASILQEREAKSPVQDDF